VAIWKEEIRSNARSDREVLLMSDLRFRTGFVNPRGTTELQMIHVSSPDEFVSEMGSPEEPVYYPSRHELSSFVEKQ
jgi:hypothetical protein